jgi:hypothetical protein
MIVLHVGTSWFFWYPDFASLEILPADICNPDSKLVQSTLLRAELLGINEREMR